MAVKRGDRGNSGLLIRAHQVAQFLGVKLFGERRRAHHITEHHCQLATLALVYFRGIASLWLRLTGGA